MKKRCFKCLRALPLDDFYKHARMSDGHLNKYKECTKKDVKKHRVEDIDRFRKYDRLRGAMPHRVAARKAYIQTAAGKKARLKAQRKQRTQHPEKNKARVAVGNAIRDGKLTKQPCFECGAPAEAHHPDYSQPLDVVWLCPKHHKAVHDMAKEILNGKK